MSGTKFTPGPWLARDYRVFKMTDDGLYHSHVGWTAGNAKQRTPQALANAQLMAAAPTMADYIKARADQGDEEARSIWRMINGTPQARAALHKARGEPW